MLRLARCMLMLNSVQHTISSALRQRQCYLRSEQYCFQSVKFKKFHSLQCTAHSIASWQQLWTTSSAISCYWCTTEVHSRIQNDNSIESMNHRICLYVTQQSIMQHKKYIMETVTNNFHTWTCLQVENNEFWIVNKFVRENLLQQRIHKLKHNSKDQSKNKQFCRNVLLLDYCTTVIL